MCSNGNSSRTAAVWPHSWTLTHAKDPVVLAVGEADETAGYRLGGGSWCSDVRQLAKIVPRRMVAALGIGGVRVGMEGNVPCWADQRL